MRACDRRWLDSLKETRRIWTLPGCFAAERVDRITGEVIWLAYDGVHASWHASQEEALDASRERGRSKR